NTVAPDPGQKAAADQQNATYNAPPGSTPADAAKTAADRGNNGLFGWVRAAAATMADPVEVVNGQFYNNVTDLLLPGPFPLALQRNYLSGNYADNMFGFGWKMNFMPFLVLITNAAGQEIISAAELEGSVI